MDSDAGPLRSDFAKAPDLVEELSEGLNKLQELLTALRRQLSEKERWSSEVEPSEKGQAARPPAASVVLDAAYPAAVAGQIRSSMGTGTSALGRVPVQRKCFADAAKDAIGTRNRTTMNDVVEVLRSRGPRKGSAHGTLNSLSNSLSGHSFVFNPISPLRTLFDALSLVVMGFDVFIIPVILAWDFVLDGPLKAMSVASVLFWSVDMCLTFNTGVYRRGELVMDRRGIAYAYLRSWFVPDLVVIAVDAISLTWFSSNQGSALLRISKFTRVFRLMRLLRVARISETFAKVKDACATDLIDVVVGIAKPLFIIIVINHWLACVWHAVGKFAPTDTGRRWLDDREDTNPIYTYSTCYHWSLTQMTPGSMQVFPRNTAERLANIMCLLVGMIVFSSIISSCAARMNEHQNLRREREQQLAALRTFLRGNCVEHSLAAIAERAALAAMRWKKQRPPVLQDLAAVSKLPSSLQIQLRLELTLKHLKPSLFRLWGALDPGALTTLALDAVETQAFASQDTVFMSGARCQAARIVSRGKLSYSAPSLPAAVLEVDSYLCEPALWLKWLHVGEAMALTGTHVVSIDADAFGTLVLSEGPFRLFAVEFGLAYYQWASSSEHVSEVRLASGRGHAPSGHEELSTLELLLPRMSLDSRLLVGMLALQAECERRSWMWFNEGDTSLQNEVAEGKAMYITDDHGSLIRIVSLQVLRIKNAAGEILVQLGELEGSRVLASVKLPGCKSRGGEAVYANADRILEDKLMEFVGKVSWVGTDMEVAVRNSRRSAFLTKYVRTVSRGELQSEARLQEAVWEPCRGGGGAAAESVAKLRTMEPPPQTLFLAADGRGGVGAYAWLTDAELEHYQGPDGELALQKFFGQHVLEDSCLAQVQRSRDGQRFWVEQDDAGLVIVQPSTPHAC